MIISFLESMPGTWLGRMSRDFGAQSQQLHLELALKSWLWGKRSPPPMCLSCWPRIENHVVVMNFPIVMRNRCAPARSCHSIHATEWRWGLCYFLETTLKEDVQKPVPMGGKLAMTASESTAWGKIYAYLLMRLTGMCRWKQVAWRG